MKVVFMGTPDFASVVLKQLISSRHEVGYVVTQTDKAKDRGKKIQFPPVKELALEHTIPVLQPEKVKGNAEFLEILKVYEPDIIVVVAYGKILPNEVLGLPKYGCINVHASLLPKLRGASPIQHAILEGEEKTGVTIMQMEEGLDTGDMLLKKEIQISKQNYSMLHDQLAEIGGELLLESLEKIEKGEITPEPQRDEESTYAKILCKQDGKIDFSKTPAEVERLIRAFDPWPGAFCQYKDNTMKLWKAAALGEITKQPNGLILGIDEEGIRIACGGRVLKVYEIQMPGKKRVKVSDYLRGNSLEIGTILN